VDNQHDFLLLSSYIQTHTLMYDRHVS